LRRLSRGEVVDEVFRSDPNLTTDEGPAQVPGGNQSSNCLGGHVQLLPNLSEGEEKFGVHGRAFRPSPGAIVHSNLGTAAGAETWPKRLHGDHRGTGPKGDHARARASTLALDRAGGQRPARPVPNGGVVR
jgi:hypothetical protein